MNNVLVIMGPTASGKSSLAIEIASQINGEIISCDSIQIYKELNIGSAKVTKEEMAGIKHHLIDIVEPDKEFSAGEFAKLANEYLSDILSRGKTPIMVGGTGLFIQGIIRGYDWSNTEKNRELRNNLIAELDKFGAKYLHKKLEDLCPERASEISVNDSKRIIRAIEVYYNKKTPCQNAPKYNFMVVAINEDRQVLYNRINSRVDQMVGSGLFNEVEHLVKKYALTADSQSMKGIGYKEVIQFFNGELTKEEAIEKIKQHSRNYAKRQLTWLRGMAEVEFYTRQDKDIIINKFLEK